MMQAVTQIRDAAKKISGDATQRTKIHAVTDITDPHSFGEIAEALATALEDFKSSPDIIGDVELSPCDLFETDVAAFQLAKRALPIPKLNRSRVGLLVNVAQIDEAEGGRRKDRVFVGATVPNGKPARLIVGYAAPNSGIYDLVLPHLSAVCEFETPAAWDEHQTFRTRDVLAPVLAGLLADHQEVVDLLCPVPLDEVRDHFEVREADPTRGWWCDSFGGGYPQLNVKTAWTAEDFPGLEYGTELKIQVDDREPVVAEYHRSLNCSGDAGKLVLATGSSGYLDKRFLDLMVKGGNAWKYLGEPDPKSRIRVLNVPAPVPA